MRKCDPAHQIQPLPRKTIYSNESTLSLSPSLLLRFSLKKMFELREDEAFKEFKHLNMLLRFRTKNKRKTNRSFNTWNTRLKLIVYRLSDWIRKNKLTTRDSLIVLTSWMNKKQNRCKFFFTSLEHWTDNRSKHRPETGPREKTKEQVRNREIKREQHTKTKTKTNSALPSFAVYDDDSLENTMCVSPIYLSVYILPSIVVLVAFYIFILFINCALRMRARIITI